MPHCRYRCVLCNVEFWHQEVAECVTLSCRLCEGACAEVVGVEPDMTPTEPYVLVQHSLDTAGPYAAARYEAMRQEIVGQMRVAAPVAPVSNRVAMALHPCATTRRRSPRRPDVTDPPAESAPGESDQPNWTCPACTLWHIEKIVIDCVSRAINASKSATVENPISGNS